MTHSPVLTVEDLTAQVPDKIVPRTLFSQLDFRMYPGERLAIIGRNGTGKSTLLRILSGHNDPFHGLIRFADLPLKTMDLKQRSHHVALVRSGERPHGELTVEEMVALGRHPHTPWHGRMGPQDKDAVRQALMITGMLDFSARKLHSLSDGERSRALIARAVSQAAPLLMLDEPMAHLDPPGKAEIASVLDSIALKGHSIVHTSHDIEMSLHHCDRVLVLTPTGQHALGAPEDLLLNGFLQQAFDTNALQLHPDHLVMESKGNRQVSLGVQAEGLTRIALTHILRRLGLGLNADSHSSQAGYLGFEAEQPFWDRGGGNRERFKSCAELFSRIKAWDKGVNNAA